MSEQETQPKGPESFENCHVCGHQPQHMQFMARVNPGEALFVDGKSEALFHRYVCTHCNEGTHRHDSKAYAGLNWNGQQLRAVRKAKEREAERFVKLQGERGAEERS